jgi:hypothetical protein
MSVAQRHVGVSSFVTLVVEGVTGALVALIVLIAVVSNLPTGSSLRSALGVHGPSRHQPSCPGSLAGS